MTRRVLPCPAAATEPELRLGAALRPGQVACRHPAAAGEGGRPPHGDAAMPSPPAQSPGGVIWPKVAAAKKWFLAHWGAGPGRGAGPAGRGARGRAYWQPRPGDILVIGNPSAAPPWGEGRAWHEEPIAPAEPWQGVLDPFDAFAHAQAALDAAQLWVDPLVAYIAAQRRMQHATDRLEEARAFTRPEFPAAGMRRLRALVVRLSDGLTEEGPGWSTEGLDRLRRDVAFALPEDQVPEWLLRYRGAIEEPPIEPPPNAHVEGESYFTEAEFNALMLRELIADLSSTLDFAPGMERKADLHRRVEKALR